MKKKIILVVVIVSLFISCKNKEAESCSSEEETVQNEKDFEMYEMSEMAALMEQMYAENLILKERILKGDTIGKFPQHFLKIHEAVLTDETDKDDFFKKEAKLFIESQELIYKDPKNAKEHFNKGVDACLSCHKVKCGGPIPRIKKLYIE